MSALSAAATVNNLAPTEYKSRDFFYVQTLPPSIACCVDTGNPRCALSGIAVENARADDTVLCYTCDTRRVAIVRTAGNVPDGMTVIPAKEALTKRKKTRTDCGADVLIDSDGKGWKSRDNRVGTMVEGRFPSIQSILPTRITGDDGDVEIDGVDSHIPYTCVTLDPEYLAELLEHHRAMNKAKDKDCLFVDIMVPKCGTRPLYIFGGDGNSMSILMPMARRVPKKGETERKSWQERLESFKAR